MQQNSSEQKKIRVALQGASQSCLTYHALRLAQGLCGNFWKVGIIDTTGYAHKYSHLGMFTTVGLTAPFQAERYFEAVALLELSGMDVIIINTISPEYSGEGGLLERMNENFEGAMRAHRALLQSIRNVDPHVICTVSTKSRLSIRSGGRLALNQEPVQQPGIEKVFDTVLHLNRSGMATVQKDITGTLPQKMPFKPDVEVGAQLQRWCSSNGTVLCDSLQWKINGCSTVSELYELLFSCDADDPKVMAAFTKRKLQLQGMRETNRELADAPF